MKDELGILQNSERDSVRESRDGSSLSPLTRSLQHRVNKFSEEQPVLCSCDGPLRVSLSRYRGLCPFFYVIPYLLRFTCKDKGRNSLES